MSSGSDHSNENNDHSNENNDNSNGVKVEVATNVTTSAPLNNFNSMTMSETIIDTGLVVINQQGVSQAGNEVTQSTFNTTDPENHVPQITEVLSETVVAGYDDTSTTGQIVAQIRTYANKIKCENFQGKGSVDDYNELFIAASKIANESKQMQLNVDIEGFTEFGAAADNLSALFESFTHKLTTVNIIDDSNFLNAVLSALIKISNLSDVFARFKETILITSTVRIPQSAYDASIVLHGVMEEVNCAMNYINNFVTPDPTNYPAGQLSSSDKNIINKAVSTIEHWNDLCAQGTSIALANDPNIQYINQTSANLLNQTNNLKNATSKLAAKFASLNIKIN